MVLTRSPHLVLALALALAVACSADGDVKGGDASADVAKVPNEASADVGPGDGGCTTTGATWTELYTLYFGPTGKGQCGKQVGCHLDNATGGGAFWTCGASKETCYQGMQNNVIKCNAAASRMPDILRKASEPFAPGKMPADPTSVTYDENDIAKISSWINAGAKND
jgi:hypothetical protein